MEIFKVDNRNRNDLLSLIEELAESYTPEWKFSTLNPDAISVIGLIYANQTLYNIKNMNQLMTKYHIEFANMYGIFQKSASAAKTICVFGVNENIDTGAELKRGTQVIGMDNEGNEIIFALSHDICIATSKLTDIIGISGRNKKLVVHKGDYKQYDVGEGSFKPVIGEGEPVGEEPIRFFDYNSRNNINKSNSYKQAIIMEFEVPNGVTLSKIALRFTGSLPDDALARLLSDKSRFHFEYVTDGEVREFNKITYNGDKVELVTNGGFEKTIVLENLSKESPCIDSVEMFITDMDKNGSFLWNGKSEVVDDIFFPFGQQPTLYDEFYIGQEFLFGQSRTRAKLHFKLEFSTYCVKNQAVYEPDLKIIKRKSKASNVKPHYNCFVQEVSFDYFNGKGWKHLKTDRDMTVLFSDIQNAGEYDVIFEIPDDWETVVAGGYEGKCIRMQVIKADNCYINDVEYYYPIFSEFGLTMVGQMRGMEPTSLSYVHGQVKEEGLSHAFSDMEYEGDYMFFGFDKRLPNGPVSLFMDVKKPSSASGKSLEFAYSSPKGFKSLKVIDDTQMFQSSGLIRFIPPQDMAQCEVEGQSRYWIRIEDKSGSNPILNDIYLNSAYVENGVEKEEQDYYVDTVTAHMRFPLYAQNIISAEVWVNEREQLSADEMASLTQSKDVETRIVYNFMGEIEEFYVLWKEVSDFDDLGDMRRCYVIDRSRNEIIFGDGVHSNVPTNITGVAFKVKVTSCDGENANIAPEAIDRFRSSILSVEDVTNPIGAYGGTDIENVGDALRRGSNILSSRKRLVSKNDYINESLLFSDTIGQVDCVVEGEKIYLVLLMKDYKKSEFSFRNIKDKLHDHLVESCEITCQPFDIRIVEPVFVRVCVDVWLEVGDVSKSLEIKQEWADKLAEYLEPSDEQNTGGWRIGKLPNVRQIRLVLSALEGNTKDTIEVKNINIMAAYTMNGIEYEVGLERLQVKPFMYCCNGNHNIYINGL
jgi:hypothetical protein